jgi:hypothetical protein
MQQPKLQKPLHNSIPAGKSQSSNHVSFTNLSPRTPAEHYWASRALKAEALLSAREKHFEEVGKVREDKETKRRACLSHFTLNHRLIRPCSGGIAEFRDKAQRKVQQPREACGMLVSYASGLLLITIMYFRLL